MGALALAERLRRNIESLPIRSGDATLRVTASLGVATSRDGGEGLLQRADDALYEAKAKGRNRSIHADGIESAGPAHSEEAKDRKKDEATS